MARMITLYTGLNLNKGLSPHIYFTDHSKYINNYLYASRLETLTLDNYRINGLVAKCNLTNNLTEENFNKVTYVAEYDTATNYYRYYHVTKSHCNSGFVVYDLEVDLWASYIANANIASVDIYRSTRFINDHGQYDPIEHVSNLWQKEYVEYETDQYGYKMIGADKIAIAILLEYQLQENIFGSITKTEMFITDSAEEVYDKVKTYTTFYDKLSALEALIDVAGNIKTIEGTLFGELDAHVLKAWVVDTRLISPTATYLTSKVKIRTNDEIEVNLWKTLPQYITQNYTIYDYDFNKAYYVGSYLNGLKLTNYATENKRLNYCITYICDDNEIKVIASQGENIKDITNMYEVFLSMVGTGDTSLRQIAKGIGLIANFSKTIASASSPLGATLGVTQMASGLMTQPPKFNNAIGGGDGALTFALHPIIDQAVNLVRYYVQSPYCLITYTSLNDETENAYKYGINYTKTYLDQLNDLWNYNPIIENFIDYLQCKAFVGNVQDDAKNFIESELLRGIDILNID